MSKTITRLGDEFEFIRGVTYSKKDEVDVSEDGLQILRANNIDINSGTLIYEDIKKISRDVKIKDKQRLRKNDILISIASGSKEHVGKTSYIEEDLELLPGGFLGIIRCDNEIDSRYLYHVLKSRIFQDYLEKTLSSSTINNLNNSIINNFEFPDFDSKKKEKIVNILDKFKRYEKELEKELEQRRKQYNYYLDKLLSWKDSSCTKYKLKDVCDFQRGKVISKAKSTPGNFPVIGGGKKPAYFVDTYNRDGEIITVAGSGAYAGYVQYFNKPIFLADAFSLTTNECNVKYIYYFLKNNQDKIHDFKKGSGVPHVYISDLEKLDINLPPIEIQKKIVCVLDKFNKIINDIQIGLPKEKELRKKQYEYYLEKLIQN